MQKLNLRKETIFKIIISIIVFPIISTYILNSESYSVWKRKDQKLKHMVIQCGIFDRRGDVLWSFPSSNLCNFFDDGSFVAARKNTLSYFDKDNNLLWRKEVTVHHQINLSLDKSKILVLSDSYHVYSDKLSRFDVLLVFDRKGNELKRFNLFDHRAFIIDRSDKGVEDFNVSVELKVRRKKEVEHEFSHANSFYEIGINDNMNRGDGVFVPGNYIVNDTIANLIFVLNKKMSKVIWALPVRERPGRRPMTHDVQVMRNGNLLVYANGDEKTFSTIDEIEPYLYDKKTLFIDDPPERFRAAFAGGVQVIGKDLLLISDITDLNPVIHEVDISKNKKIFTLRSPFVKNKDSKGSFQQVKAYDLSSFLKNNKGF